MASVAIGVILVGLTIWIAARTRSAAPLVIVLDLILIDALVLWVTRRASRRRGQTPRTIGWVLVALSALYLAWFATNPFGAALPGGIMMPGTLHYGGRTYNVQRTAHHVWHAPVISLHGNACFLLGGLGGAPPTLPSVGSVRVPFLARLPVGVERGNLLWVYVPSARCAVSYLPAGQPRRSLASPTRDAGDRVPHMNGLSSSTHP